MRKPVRPSNGTSQPRFAGSCTPLAQRRPASRAVERLRETQRPLFDLEHAHAYDPADDADRDLVRALDAARSGLGPVQEVAPAADAGESEQALDETMPMTAPEDDDEARDEPVVAGPAGVAYRAAPPS